MDISTTLMSFYGNSIVEFGYKIFHSLWIYQNTYHADIFHNCFTFQYLFELISAHTKKCGTFSTIFRNLQNNFHDFWSRSREFSHVWIWKASVLFLSSSLRMDMVLYAIIFRSITVTPLRSVQGSQKLL